MYFKSLCIFTLIFSSPVVNSAKILGFFSMPMISHSIVFRPLINELVERGHEVTVVATDPEYKNGEKPKNLIEIDVHDISYEKWRESFVTKVDGLTSISDLLHTFMQAQLNVFEAQLNMKEVQNLLSENNKFDLILMDTISRLYLVLGHLLKTPLIQISTAYITYPHYQIHGAAYHPIFHPEIVRKRIYNLTLVEKIQAVYAEFEFRYQCWMLEATENALVRKMFGPDTPTMAELTSVPHMIFVNSNPIWDGNRAVPPSVIFLGQMQMKPPKELPSDIKYYIESAKEGVIYMSFGTTVNPTLLPPEKIQIFCRVFSKLPYKIIWKWNGDNLPGKPGNVMISKWLPQADILRHKNVKLFIMQGGLQSTDEAIEGGVPLIAFPMLGDQWVNAEKFVRFGIGKQLDFGSITDETLEDAISNVIGDSDFRSNMLRLRNFYHDQPQSPLERAVWWTEYVLRHGGAKHLRSPMANISWSEYLMLDVVGVLLLMVTISLMFFICGIRSVLRFFCKQPVDENKKMKKS